MTRAGPRPVTASWQARAIDAGHVLWSERLVDPDGVLPGEAREPPGEERLEGEVAPILLSDEHDERARG